ncbi:hypothetical protein BO94DRAFT_563946 [Aspergillus sclerotioniger CBS 115572]|uniref:Uncharacterized protein n=1 Tax=Aspergillus sclerotioniger CBS 115572 TaxID=1450535 RepID=A0A317X7N5_9EURO|nr:hypothetical protein BO94DRAFT_563946 [Aspergillus sclerotioniger CBS 115572]PWY93567.1 hypothetical protein BO94DRAFT_563946 [Aspergillus sclerotioniger CBS 115572]
MYSYHRLLQIFGRSIHDNTLECDLDVHPWEIKINGKNWSGKVRLIGFVDVFFIISYSGNARFEDGIIVYTEFTHRRTYRIKSRGHHISLSTKYLKSSVEHYTVEIIKPRDWALRRRVKRGIRPHAMAQLLVDVVRYGVISQGQLMGHVGGLLFVGGTLDETAHKFWQGLTANKQSGQQALSNEGY